MKKILKKSIASVCVTIIFLSIFYNTAMAGCYNNYSQQYDYDTGVDTWLSNYVDWYPALDGGHHSYSDAPVPTQISNPQHGRRERGDGTIISADNFYTYYQDWIWRLPNVYSNDYRHRMCYYAQDNGGNYYYDGSGTANAYLGLFVNFYKRPKPSYQGCEAPRLADLSRKIYNVGNTYWVKPNDSVVFVNYGFNGSDGDWLRHSYLHVINGNGDLIGEADAGNGRASFFHGWNWLTAELNYATSSNGMNTGVYQFSLKRDGETATFQSAFLNGAGTGNHDGNYTGNASDTNWKDSGYTLKSDGVPPTYTSYEVKNVTESGYDVYVYGVNDSESGVSKALFTTNAEKDGEAGSITTQGEDLGGGTWHYRVKTSDYNGKTGWYNTNITLYDNVENSTLVKIPRICVDTTPPTITANPAKVSWVNKDITVTLTAKDVGTGVKDIYYAWSQSNTVEPTDFTKVSVNEAPEIAIATTTQTQEGQWYLWYYADDNAEPINVTPKAYSGLYQIDKTPPVVNVNPTTTYWTNKDVKVTLTAKDDLSGVKDIYYAWSKSNTDAPATFTKVPINGGTVATTTATQTQEGIWYLWYYADDNANTANASAKVFAGTYLIDKTPPTNSFSVSPGIFQGSGVKIQPSIHGADNGMYGTLTFQDDLSGVESLSYSWTFGSSDSGVAYTNIYTSPQTYTDRSQEKINKDIEKPVGDNLYLHVKEYDQAGNYTYTTYGPFEDPIALSNFEITNMTDPEWEQVFWKDSELTQPTGKTFKVNQLPVDNTSNTVYRNAEIKKGYAFNFDITSKYLYRDNDRIEIKPFFYYWDGTNRIPVNMYYNLNNNPFTRAGSTADTLRLNLDTTNGSVWIGGLTKLTLTKGVRIVDGAEFNGISGWQNKIQYNNGKTQWWYGRYYIPSNSIFVKNGDTPTPDKILSNNHIIVNFQIIGYKNGIETLSQDQMYNYVDNNWTAEGGPKNSNYQPGDVIVYDNSKSVLDDYTAHIIQ